MGESLLSCMRFEDGLKMDWDILTYKDKKDTKMLQITQWGRSIRFKLIMVGKDKIQFFVEFMMQTEK